MMAKGSSMCRRTSPRRGLTLIEMIISIPLVGIALVAALNIVGASKVSQFKVSVSREAHLLAQDLMTEILLQDYTDPEIARTARDDILSTGDATYSLGREGSESGSNRADFDDVDDYANWTASPPEYKDGTVIPNMPGWERSASVAFTSVSDLRAVRASDFGWKRITVTVKHNAAPAAELVALKAIGLPWLEACCFDDGSCEHLRAEACTAQGGTAQGSNAKCANTECLTGPAVLFVVVDDTNPTAQELARQVLIESWDSSVELIAASASQADFDASAASVDVAYVCETINATYLGTKLAGASIGVVNEEPNLVDEFGFASDVQSKSRNEIDIIDNGHFITSPFGTGLLTYLSSLQDVALITGGEAPGLTALGTLFNTGNQWKTGLAVIDVSGALYGGGTAAGRRVQLPWGYSVFDFNSLNTDGQTIMHRAIEWAAGMEHVCGDGDCDVGEECNCPADCGVPVAFEQPGVDCDDGLDNDCDGDTDCDDINCPADPACAVCSNGICETGEDCNSCAADCPGKSNGPPSGRYCCGNGIAESAEGDGSICDGNY